MPHFTQANYQDVDYGLTAAMLEWAGLYSQADSQTDPGGADACILPPSAVEGQADAKAAETAKLDAAFKSGELADLNSLTLMQLRALGSQNGISPARTKSEMLKYLDLAEPGVDHSGLGGKALIDEAGKLHVSRTRSKEDLAALLSEKQAAIKAAQHLSGVEKKIADAISPAPAQVDTGKIAALQASIDGACSDVVVPVNPASWSAFVSSIAKAETSISAGGGLDQAYLTVQIQSIALKKKLFSDQLAAMTGKELRDVAKKTGIQYYQWANKADLITLMTESDAGAAQPVKDKLFAAYKAHKEKHSGASAPADKTTTAPPPPPPPPPKAPLTKPKPVSAFDAIDESWESDRGLPARFTLEGTAKNLGGAHPKEIWTDKDGARWMFKPADLPFLPHAEEMAYRVGRLVDPDAIEVRAITLNGRIGTIQKLRTDLKSKIDFSGMASMAELTAEEIQQLQREHVIDWLISNHDNHAKNFIRCKNGRIYGVDKGQAGKFVEKPDRLVIGYNPNSNHGGLESMYDRLFRAVRAKQISIDPNAILPCIEAVERITDAQYIAAMEPYVRSLRGNTPRFKQTMDRYLERKHSIRADFERYYADATGQKAFKFGVSTPAPKSPERVRFEQAVADIPAVGFQGKALKIDGSEIEDQTLLAWQQFGKGKKVDTVLSGKLRAESNHKVMVLINGQPTLNPYEAKSRDLHGSILGAVKTIAHHTQQGDTAYNAAKIKAALDTIPELSQILAQHPESSDLHKMAKHYMDTVNKVIDTKDNGTPWDTQFKFFSIIPAPPAATAAHKAVSVERIIDATEKRTVKNGQLHADGKRITNRTLVKRNSSGLADGYAYKVDIGEGVEFIYRPDVDANPFAQRSHIEIKIAGAPSVENIDKAMAHFNAVVGVNSGLSTEADEELVYLTKLAYMRREDMQHETADYGGRVFKLTHGGSTAPNPLISDTAEWKTLVSSLETKGASSPERVAALESFWNAKLGKELRKDPAYNPRGVESSSFIAKGKTAGKDRQYRPDILADEIELEMNGHTVYHSTEGVGRDSGTSTMVAFFEAAMSHNGLLVSTMERARIGIPITRGASCAADIMSGGATYSFTRILPSSIKEKTPGLYFKTRLLGRMDAITFKTDEFGKVKDGNVNAKRLTSISGFKDAATNPSNETIFKESIALLDELDVVVTGGASYRDAILKAFKDNGITHLNDGRAIEDIILVKKYGN